MSEAYHLGDSHFRFIIAFDALNFFAVITLSAVLATAWFSSRIRRVSTWYLYIFSWDVYSAGYLLILGKQTGSEPVWGWCLFQSMIIYATPLLTAASIVIFVTQVYLDIRSALGFSVPEPDTVKKFAIIPGILFVTIICEVLIIGFSLPDLVSRSPSGMFCRIEIPLPGQVTGVMVALCVVLGALLGVSIASMIHRNRERWQSLTGSREFQSYDLLFRLAVFLLAPLCAIGLVVIKFLPSNHNVPMGGVNILFAVLPTMVAIVSSSQKDILHVWIFWRSSSTNGAVTEEDKERQVDYTSSGSMGVQQV